MEIGSNTSEDSTTTITTTPATLGATSSSIANNGEGGDIQGTTVTTTTITDQGQEASSADTQTTSSLFTTAADDTTTTLATTTASASDDSTTLDSATDVIASSPKGIKINKKPLEGSKLFTLAVIPNYNNATKEYKSLVQVDPTSSLITKYKSVPPPVDPTLATTTTPTPVAAATTTLPTPTTTTTAVPTPVTPATATTEKVDVVPLEVIEQAKVIPGLFIEGFLPFYKSGLFTDATVTCGGVQFKVHKMVLGYRSSYFREIFQTTSDCVIDEKSSNLSLCNVDQVFPTVIEYLYSGMITIDRYNVVSLKLLANFLDVDPLKCEVENFLLSFINAENVFDVLDSAIISNDNSIKSICVDSIAYNFDILNQKLVEKVFDNDRKFPLDIFFSIIGNKNMKSNPTEERVKIVSEIVQRFIDEFKAFDNIELFKNIINASVDSRSLDVELAIKYLQYCDSHVPELEEQSGKCSQILAANFYTLLNSGRSTIIYDVLPNTFVELLRCDELYTKDEDQVYEIACNYIESNKDKLTQEQKVQIFKCVRYTYLSIPLLTKLKNDPLFVSKEDILEALWSRVSRLEGKKNDESVYSTRPRKIRVFIYEKDFDTNGILYWLGTNYSQEAYTSPMDRSYLSVTASSNFEVGSAKDLVSHEPTKCNLIGKANAFIIIKFETIRVMPTKYSLRHTMSRDGEALRHWTLSGSSDGINYSDIFTHTNDQALNLKGSTGSWDLNCTSYYQYFKITQTANNSSNNNYFSLAGVEFYGLISRICE
ncbi:predicted protein [Naegleria gruberi]|uniref:Predicted protein n=1 Tax=Naegleria gruberi TaxID=5762 RepID=D2VF28_NAEGR|nr:uncharacterized protein NAEGRDRAFT_79706 [Naegleria gruberi]EFC44703.1 predicted protein [Naegleria gruberi]|eukprot:XP_002677447.1 predicted protein [Naegleria gruberi strain NEG-M]